MSKLGKFDIRFITFVNKVYEKRFKNFDDYIQFLFYEFCEEDTEKYNIILEENIRSFCLWQEENMSKW